MRVPLDSEATNRQRPQSAVTCISVAVVGRQLSNLKRDKACTRSGPGEGARLIHALLAHRSGPDEHADGRDRALYGDSKEHSEREERELFDRPRSGIVDQRGGHLTAA